MGRTSSLRIYGPRLKILQIREKFSQSAKTIVELNEFIKKHEKRGLIQYFYRVWISKCISKKS